MKLAELAAHGRTPPAPCTVELAEGSRLHITAWLRVLPGQRYVGQARWQGPDGQGGQHVEHAVLAKLLLGPKAAKRYQAELSGARDLAQAAITTPALRAHGQARHRAWLLFDWLHKAHSLQDEWLRLTDAPLLSTAQQQVLGEALTTIGQLHRCGLWQADLHLDNLMRCDGALWVIDAGSVRAQGLGCLRRAFSGSLLSASCEPSYEPSYESLGASREPLSARRESVPSPRSPLSARRAHENLALFFAQLSPVLEPYIDALLPHYLSACPQPGSTPASLVAALRPRIARQRARRLRDYLAKTCRDCSLFAVQHTRTHATRSQWQVVHRSEAECLAPLLPQLDVRLEAQLAAGTAYKAGASASVAALIWQGRRLVLKRYNIKGFAHWLRRAGRASRAVHSWRAAHRLAILDIATPRPLAVIETRRWGLSHRAYLLTEHGDGPDLLACFADYLHTPREVLLTEVALLEKITALAQLCASLRRARVSHGDLKGTNLIWQGSRWALIDLDALRAHRCPRRFERAYARDRARLLRNLPAHSALQQLLDERLPRG